MVRPLVRRPRTKPAVKLPQRSEYDGRIGQSIESILSEQPSFGFLRFGAGAIGWEYGGHVEEWRRCFSKHLEAFIAQYMSDTGEVPEELRRKVSEVGFTPKCDGHMLSGIRATLSFYGLIMRKLPHMSTQGKDCYQLPFGLLMLVSSGDRLYAATGAREYAHGAIVQRSVWSNYLIIGPLAQEGSI